MSEEIRIPWPFGGQRINIPSRDARSLCIKIGVPWASFDTMKKEQGGIPHEITRDV